MDNLREVSSWSIDLPSKANFSLPLNVDVLVALSYEILFCSRFDNLKFDKFSPLLESEYNIVANGSWILNS